MKAHPIHFLYIQRFFPLLFLLWAVISCLLTGPAFGGKADLKILILNSYHQGDNWADSEVAGILSVLQKAYPDLVPAIEYLDTKRYPGVAYQDVLKEHLTKKYKGKVMDLLFVLDNPALDLLLKVRRDIFPKVPVVFAGINNFNPQMIKGQERITGTSEDLQIEDTIKLALTLHPGTNKVFVINDFTSTGLMIRGQVERLIPTFKRKVQFEFNLDVPWSELEGQLKGLSADSLILLIAYTTDGIGRTFPRQESTRLISSIAPVPVYGLTEARLGYGIVGGLILSGRHHGREAAEMGLTILQGRDPDAMPVKSSQVRPMFDYRQLIRFKIPESALPPHSLILNRPISFWDKNRDLLFPVFLVVGFLILLLLIISLTLFRIRRAELRVRQSEDRFRKLVDTAPEALLVFDVDLKRFVQVNAKAEELFGCSRDEW
jgi:PAS domain-containing protein